MLETKFLAAGLFDASLPKFVRWGLGAARKDTRTDPSLWIVMLEVGTRRIAARIQAPPDSGAARARGPSGPGPRVPSMVAILDAVTRGTGIDREALIAPGQRQTEVRARHLAMCLIRELCPGVSLAAIGKTLDRDPATVFYGCRRAEALRRRDRGFRETYLRIRNALIAGCSEAGSRG